MNLNEPEVNMESSKSPFHDYVAIEALAKKFRDLHREEGKRQSIDFGDTDFCEYNELPENIKDFYRVLARHVIGSLDNCIKALQFYADTKSWLEILDNGVVKNAYDDMGEKARIQLKEMGLDKE